MIEDISVVNNYRSQFDRVIERSSFAELVRSMGKTIVAGKNPALKPGRARPAIALVLRSQKPKCISIQCTYSRSCFSDKKIKQSNPTV